MNVMAISKRLKELEAALGNLSTAVAIVHDDDEGGAIINISGEIYHASTMDEAIKKAEKLAEVVIIWDR